MNNKKIAAPLIVLVMGIVLVSIGVTVSSKQEGKLGLLILIFAVVLLFTSLVLFLKLRKSSKDLVEK
jgi:hypothetical protein